MKQLHFIITAIAASFIFSNVQAQYTGPGSEIKLYTVNEVIDQASKLDKSDYQIKIEGFVIEQINKDTFWFKDKTGKIRIEIDKKQLPTTPFNEKTELIIMGEVDYDFLEGVEIEVENLIVK